MVVARRQRRQFQLRLRAPDGEAPLAGEPRSSTRRQTRVPAPPRTGTRWPRRASTGSSGGISPRRSGLDRARAAGDLPFGPDREAERREQPAPRLQRGLDPGSEGVRVARRDADEVGELVEGGAH